MGQDLLHGCAGLQQDGEWRRGEERKRQAEVHGEQARYVTL